MAVVAVAGCGGSSTTGDAAPAPADGPLPPPADAAPPVDAHVFTDAELTAAAATFRANCATCHGTLGAGGQTWITGDGAPSIAGKFPVVIILTAREGRPPAMPAFHEDEIPDDQLAALAEYVSSLPDGWRAPPAFDAEVTISDRDPWFAPVQLRVEPGQTVHFHNDGATYHDVSQLEWLTSEGATGVASGQLGPNGDFYATFPTAGAYTFLCKDHPYMRGTIHVGEDFTPPTHAPSVPLPPPVRAGLGEVWVTAQFQDQTAGGGDGVVHVIDAATWTDVRQLDVGNNPHNLWVLDGGATLLATNWFDNTLSVIDAAAGVVTLERPVGATPAHVLAPPGAGVVWISIEGSHYLETLDAATWGFVNRRTMLSGNMPHGIGYGGGLLLVANSMTDDAAIVDVATDTELANVPAGRYPMGAAVTTDGALGFVGNCLDGTMSVIDMLAGVKLADVALGGCVVQVAVTDDGARVVVAHGDQTAIVDVATLTVLADLDTGQGAHGVTIGPAADGGTFAYVTHKYDNHVAVIDVDTAAHLGDVALVHATTGRAALVGVTDTGAQGIAVRLP